MESSEVLKQLREKYPPRHRQLPDRVRREDPLTSLSGLRESLINMKGGVSPGCGGLCQEYLTVLGCHLNQEAMQHMEDFGMKYLRGNLPPWFYCCWLTVQCVPLYKTEGRDTVRPLGLRNPLLKSFHREVSRANREVVKSFVEPQQMLLSAGGGCKLVFTVRGLVELIQPGTEYEDWAVVKIDIRNAHNEAIRAETVRVMESEPTLRHLASYTAAILAPHSGLESGGHLWGMTGEGGTQGDPRTSDDFIITLQPSLILLDAAHLWYLHFRIWPAIRSLRCCRTRWLLYLKRIERRRLNGSLDIFSLPHAPFASIAHDEGDPFPEFLELHVRIEQIIRVQLTGSIVQYEGLVCP